MRAVALPLLVAMGFACSGAEEPAREVESIRVEERSAEDWVAIAREASRQPRHTGFHLQPGRSETQTGSSTYLDALHFRVTTQSRMTRSHPDGPVQHTPITIELGCNGEELRILPSVDGRPGRMMFLPAARLAELPATSPAFTLQQLDPLHFQAALLDLFTATALERPGDGRILLQGTIPDGTLADFGMGGTDVVDAGAGVHLILDEATAKLLSLRLVPADLHDGTLELSLPDLDPAPEGTEAYLLALPPDAATMDLTQSLPEATPSQD